MNLQFMKAGTTDALVLNSISKQAFDSDVEVGAASQGGPPGYRSVPFHMKMARKNIHRPAALPERVRYLNDAGNREHVSGGKGFYA